MASSKNNKHDSFQFWTWVELWGSWLTTRGRVKGITPVHAQMKESVSLVFKSNFCLELFNCRDPMSTCARQDYWNDNVPAPFGRAWTFLSRPFLEVFFPAQLFTSRGKLQFPSGSAIMCCWVLSAGWSTAALERYGLPWSSEQAVSEEDQGERHLQECPPHF